MTESKVGLQISRKSFLSSVIILLLLMLAAGILTRVIPAGQFARVVENGRESIVPGSYQTIGKVDYPIWRWVTAPLEVLWGPDAALVILIIVFLLMIGGSIAVLEKSDILRYSMQQLVDRFGQHKYRMMAVLVLFFMLLGAFIGTFEEMIALVPLAITLAISLGWDSLTGLGMSLLAAGFGFAAAISNPFTVGVAQRLAGLPAFSGVAYRLLVFAIIYVLLITFLLRHAHKVERDPTSSPVHAEDAPLRAKFASGLKGAGQDALPTIFDQTLTHQTGQLELKLAMRTFGIFLALILVVIVLGFVLPPLADISLPLVGLFFLIGALVAGRLSQYASFGAILKDLLKGMVGILPAILLILMAMSVKHIMTAGNTMDTILFYASERLSGMSPYMAGFSIYLLILFLEFFISSGSAKAFLVIPIIAPLVDIVGLTRQSAVLAFTFGDGFSNVFFPTNAALLIALGLTVVSYAKWFKWTIKLQVAVFGLTLLLLFAAIGFGYGPF
jgi:uncharacterized ion transporter superfamily protein YfcC